MKEFKHGILTIYEMENTEEFIVLCEEKIAKIWSDYEARLISVRNEMNQSINCMCYTAIYHLIKDGCVVIVSFIHDGYNSYVENEANYISKFNVAELYHSFKLANIGSSKTASRASVRPVMETAV